MLFQKAIELFIKYLQMVQKSEETITHYKSALEKFNKYLTDTYNCPVFLDEVKADDVEKYLFNVLNAGKYSSSHRHNFVTSFKSLYKYCVSKGHCEINIGKLVKHIKVETKEREYISEFELAKIVKLIKSPTIRALLQTIFYTGLRISEAIKLKIVDVDFEHEIIYVREGKGRKERTIPMNQKLKKIMLEYLKNSRIDAGKDFFFSCRTGTISVEHICPTLKEALQKSGIEKKVTPHVLRHSFASHLIEGGVNLLRVQKLLGHESIETTSIYLHTNMEELEKAVNLL